MNREYLKEAAKAVESKFHDKQIELIEPDWKSLYYSLALRVTRANEKMAAGNSDGARGELVTAAEVVRAWQRLMDIQHTIVQFNEIGKSEPDPDKLRDAIDEAMKV